MNRCPTVICTVETNFEFSDQKHFKSPEKKKKKKEEDE